MDSSAILGYATGIIGILVAIIVSLRSSNKTKDLLLKLTKSGAKLSESFEKAKSAEKEADELEKHYSDIRDRFLRNSTDDESGNKKS